MPKPNSNRSRRRSHTMHVMAAADSLAEERQKVVGVDWTGRNDELLIQLGQAAHFGAEIDGRATRMDADGASRRARCAEFVQRAGVNALSSIAAVEFERPHLVDVR